MLLNKYFIGYLLVYLCASLVLIFSFHQAAGDLLITFLCFGLILSLLGWFLFKKGVNADPDKALFKNEILVIIGLILFFVWYVTYGSAILNKLIPLSIQSVEWKNEIAI